MMKPLASFLILLLCSTVHSKSSSRADKISQRSGVLPKTTVIRENEGTATVVKLLRARKTYFEGAFFLSHIVALIKCITTVDILFKDPSLSLDSAINSAVGSSIGDVSILPAASLQSIYSFFQVILSLSCHIGYNYILRQFPSVREFICFAETNDLPVATAALVLKEEAGWGDAVSESRRVIVPLESSDMQSVSQCLSRLHVTSSSTAIHYKQNPQLFSSDFADRGRNTYTTEAREVEVDDIKLFLFQRSKQQPAVRASKKSKSKVKLCKVKRKRKKSSEGGLTVVAAVPNCNMHLKELKEMVSHMDKYDKQVRDKNKTNKENITSDAVAFGLTAVTAIERLKLYGSNRITVRPPSVRERLASRFLSSAYIMNTFFQFLCILEEPIQTPLRRIAMSVFMDAGDILRDSNSAKRLEREVSSTNAQHTLSSSSSSSSAGECTVIRDSKEIQIKIEEVVPGDILCLSEGYVPADCLLLEGSCVVNEAFLTGEAVPQPRESIDYTYIDESLESVTEGGSCEGKNKEGESIGEEEDAEEGGAAGYLCLLKHQKSILYGGSDILQYTCSEPLYSRQPLRCLVLKTGFSSVQGVLVRKMKALGGKLNAPGAGSGLLSPALQRDASKLLAWLSVSAVGFSLHMYRQGRLQGMSRYRLLVQVCRIIASVASPDIDKDITFTIRKSARRLTRMEEVYCTDPSKLAVAGLVTACLFDKTGTIATDIVVAGDAVTLCQGALPAGDENEELNVLRSHVDPLLYSPSILSNLNDDINSVKAEWRKQEWSLSASPLGLQIVVATCHSAMELQSTDGTSNLQRYIGDPLECALLDRLTRPPDLRSATVSRTKATDNVKIESSAGTGIGAGTGLGIGTGVGQVRGSWEIDVNSKSAVWIAEALDSATDRSEELVTVRTIVSFPFDVKLQRMSVVATLSRPSSCHSTSSEPHTGLGEVLGLGGGGEGEDGLGGKGGGVGNYVSGDNKQGRGQASPHDTITEHFISTKGSPESVFTCLSSQQRQDKMFTARYFAEFERLARQGKRVIAFASKSVPVQSTISSMSRQDAEENLHFQGFVSFACPIRSDSRAAITALTDAKLKVAMLTGDSLLTALHTARECLIIGGRSSADEIYSESSASGKDRDSERDGDGDKGRGCSSDVTDVTESKVLVLSVSKRDGDKDRISIAPKGHEVHALPVMERLVWKDEEGHEVYKYCSDAWKNPSRRKHTDVSMDSSSNDSDHDHDVDDVSDLVGLSARELSSLGGFDLVTSGDAIALLCTGGPGSPKGDMDELRYFKVFARADPETKSSVVKAFKSAGEVVLMCGDGANDVLALKSADVGVALLTGFNLLNADSSGFSVPRNGTATSAEHAKASHRVGAVEEKKGDDEDEDDEGDVKIGDASAAAPFTARRPSIYSVVGLIRHGRAAHVMVLHSFQVVCIEAMLRGTALSLLFLHSIRYTPEQSLVLEVILLVVNFGLLQVPPVDTLSQRAPPPSILSPHMLQRLVIQIVHHVASVIFGLRVGLALDARYSASAPALPSPYSPTAGGALKPVTADTGFKVHGPQARNTVMFLLSVMQAASIPLGAYMGRPFLPDTQEMPKLRHTIVLVAAASIMAALQLIPGLNTSLDLFVLTRVIDRVKVLLVVGLSFIIVTCGVAHIS